MPCVRRSELLRRVVALAADVTRVYAGDRVSDLLREASPTTLVVTHLASPQLLRVAELMDLPGICFVRGHRPDAAVAAAATRHGVVLLVSPLGLFETCGRLQACLGDPARTER